MIKKDGSIFVFKGKGRLSMSEYFVDGNASAQAMPRLSKQDDLSIFYLSLILADTKRSVDVTLQSLTATSTDVLWIPRNVYTVPDLRHAVSKTAK